MRSETSIGDLRNRVIISRSERTPDGMGGWSIAPLELAVLWASVRVPSSENGVIAGGEVEVRTHIVRVRQTDITMSVQINDIVTWRGFKLVVKACRPLGREWVDFDCRLEVPE